MEAITLERTDSPCVDRKGGKGFGRGYDTGVVDIHHKEARSMKRKSLTWLLCVVISLFFFTGRSSANHQLLDDRSYAASDATFTSSVVKGTWAILTIPSGFGYGSHACSSAGGESVFVQRYA
jgi:hypothetical protein